MNVTGVDFVSLPSRDLDRAREFYADVIGLEHSSTWQRGDQPVLGMEFEAGDVTIALITSEELGLPFQPNKVPLALHVEDVESSRAELESKGIEFHGETIDSGVCYMANFSDPDGNALMLHHRYAPKRERG